MIRLLLFDPNKSILIWLLFDSDIPHDFDLHLEIKEIFGFHALSPV